MHFLILASYYPTMGNPIVGTFIEKQALALRKAGHQVGVLVLPRLSATREQARRGGLASLRTATREQYFEYAADIPVYRMHWGWFPRPLPPVAAWLAITAGERAYQAYVQAHGTPDALYAHDIFYGGVLAVAIGQKFGVRTLLIEHSTAHLEGRTFFPRQKAIIKQVLRAVDVPMAVGSTLSQQLGASAPGKTVGILGNVIDTDRFTPQPPPANPPFRFAIVAGLSERRKSIDLLLHALAQVRARGGDATLTIGGDGPLRDELSSLAANLGLAAHSQFLGRLKPVQVHDLFASSHAVICSSTIETFNVTIAEAMACGVPVLSTRCGGPEDYISAETGIIVEPGSVAALADGMTRMIAEYERFDRAAARQIIVDRFSEAAIVRQLEAVARGAK